MPLFGGDGLSSDVKDGGLDFPNVFHGFMAADRDLSNVSELFPSGYKMANIDFKLY